MDEDEVVEMAPLTAGVKEESWAQLRNVKYQLGAKLRSYFLVEASLIKGFPDVCLHAMPKRI